MKILIVDDEALVRRSLEKVFLRAQFEVKTAADGNEGYEQWRSFKPDLVMLDVLMPGLTGPQVLQKINDPTCKVILMSAYSGDYDLQNLKGFGVVDFIPKPFGNVFEIVDRVKAILEKK